MPSLPVLSYIALAVFLAGIVRGATGFGFSMIMIVLLTLVLPPAQAAPVILLWEILASVAHLPFIYRSVDWKSLVWLCLGVFVGTPAGVYGLAHVPALPMKICIDAVVLVLVLMMLKGVSLRGSGNRLQTVGVGVVSGVINGASANGGPPVIMYFFSSPERAAIGRASLVAFFFVTDVVASLFCWQQGLVGRQTILFALVFLVPLVPGIWLGHRWFKRVKVDRFNRTVILLLLAVAAVSLVLSLFEFIL